MKIKQDVTVCLNRGQQFVKWCRDETSQSRHLGDFSGRIFNDLAFLYFLHTLSQKRTYRNRLAMNQDHWQNVEISSLNNLRDFVATLCRFYQPESQCGWKMSITFPQDSVWAFISWALYNNKYILKQHCEECGVLERSARLALYQTVAVNFICSACHISLTCKSGTFHQNEWIGLKGTAQLIFD